MKQTFLITFMLLIFTFFAVSNVAAQVCTNPAGCSYTFVTVTINYSANIVQGYSSVQGDYTFGLNFNPAVLGAIYRTDDVETDLDSKYNVGYGSVTPAVVNLSTSNFVGGKTYCNYTVPFQIRRSTGQRRASPASEQCKTINIQPTPTPTITPNPTPTPTPTPVIIEVNSVGFGGDYPVYKFPAGTLIPDPTWTKGSSTNAGNVVAYTKGTETSVMKLSANFTLTTPPVQGQPVNVKVRVKNQSSVIATTEYNISVTGSTFSLQDLQVTTALEATPQVKKGNYTFSWEITVDDGQTWRPAGSSEHVVYWTYAKPINIDNDSFCQSDAIKRNCISINKQGDIDFPGLLDKALEKATETLNSTIQDPDSIAKTLAKNIDNDVVYNPSGVGGNGDERHPLFLYSIPFAQCSANANLLHSLLRSIGIDADVIYSWGGNPINGETGGRANFYKYQILVRDAGGNITGTITRTVTFKVKRPQKNSGGESVVKDPHFSFHAMVKLNGKFYDPSYGANLFNEVTYPFSDIRLVETVDFPTSNFNNVKWKHDNDTNDFVVKALTMKTFCSPTDANTNCINDPNANIALTNKLCNRHSEYLPSSTPDPFGFPDRRISNFDSDLITDKTVWRPSEGKWYAKRSSDETTSEIVFGVAGDKIVPDDYDGDGITDYAIWRPSTGDWWIQKSTDNSVSTTNFGFSTDKPIVGDYDGDRKADIAVYRPSNGNWYINRSRDGFIGVQFGLTADKPVVGDFDHDNKSDIAVYRPSTGTWYILRSSDAGVTSLQFGINEDIPLPADFDGDGTTDIAVYRPSSHTWYVQRSTEGFLGFAFGTTGSIPVVGDYDGDGISDFAVWQSSGFWSVWSSNDEEIMYDNWGTSGDIPVPSAFNQ